LPAPSVQREELAPGSLKLELTETMVMENPELSLQVLERLKALGLGLSCDDFGTGYSSLSYLRRLPFDTLKVDRSFLLAGLEDERGSVVLDAIILLAHDLGLQVVCEGVENEAQMVHLASLECDLVQGFLIGEPIDAQQVLEALGAPHPWR
jgi:EAL domain-containing protein (putative c-di-GMP-specific phosphodiesterase class I)